MWPAQQIQSCRRLCDDEPQFDIEYEPSPLAACLVQRGLYKPCKSRRTLRGYTFDEHIQVGLDYPGLRDGCIALEEDSFYCFRNFFEAFLDEAHLLPSDPPAFAGDDRQAVSNMRCHELTEQPKELLLQASLEICGEGSIDYRLRHVQLQSSRNLACLPFAPKISRAERRKLHDIFQFHIAPSVFPTDRAIALLERPMQKPDAMVAVSLAGGTRDWPDARAAWSTEGVTLKVNGEDHIELIVEETKDREWAEFSVTGSREDVQESVNSGEINIIAVIERYLAVEQAVEDAVRKLGLSFACSDDFGYLTCNPVNMGAVWCKATLPVYHIFRNDPEHMRSLKDIERSCDVEITEAPVRSMSLPPSRPRSTSTSIVPILASPAGLLSGLLQLGGGDSKRDTIDSPNFLAPEVMRFDENPSESKAQNAREIVVSSRPKVGQNKTTCLQRFLNGLDSIIALDRELSTWIQLDSQKQFSDELIMLCVDTDEKMDEEGQLRKNELSVQSTNATFASGATSPLRHAVPGISTSTATTSPMKRVTALWRRDSSENSDRKEPLEHLSTDTVFHGYSGDSPNSMMTESRVESNVINREEAREAMREKGRECGPDDSTRWAMCWCCPNVNLSGRAEGMMVFDPSAESAPRGPKVVNDGGEDCSRRSHNTNNEYLKSNRKEDKGEDVTVHDASSEWSPIKGDKHQLSTGKHTQGHTTTTGGTIARKLFSPLVRAVTAIRQKFGGSQYGHSNMNEANEDSKKNGTSLRVSHPSVSSEADSPRHRELRGKRNQLASIIADDNYSDDYPLQGDYLDLPDSQGDIKPRIEMTLGSDYPCFPRGTTSLLAQFLTEEVYGRLQDRRTWSGCTLADIILPGTENPLLPVGVLAGDAECYELFHELLDPMIEKLHSFKPGINKIARDCTFAKLSGVFAIDPEYVRSVSIQASRNLRGFALAPRITRADRREVERVLRSALEQLVGPLRGEYFPLRLLDTDTIKELAGDGLLFGKPPEGSALQLASGARDWPDGRGIFVAKDFVVWVNQSDHLRVIAKDKGADILKAFERWSSGMMLLEALLRKGRGSSEVSNSTSPLSFEGTTTIQEMTMADRGGSYKETEGGGVRNDRVMTASSSAESATKAEAGWSQKGSITTSRSRSGTAEERGGSIQRSRAGTTSIEDKDIERSRSGKEQGVRKRNVQTPDSAGYGFEYSSFLGYITCCPSNLGTGLYAIVTLHLPLLARHEDWLVSLCESMGLRARPACSALTSPSALFPALAMVNGGCDGAGYECTVSTPGGNNTFSRGPKTRTTMGSCVHSASGTDLAKSSSSDFVPFGGRPRCSTFTNDSADVSILPNVTTTTMQIIKERVSLAAGRVSASDGLYDISNSSCMGATEVQLVQRVIDGVAALIEIEKKVEGGANIEDFLHSKPATPPLPRPSIFATSPRVASPSSTSSS